MPASMSLSNDIGNFTFDPTCLPLFQKDFEYVRFDPQGPSIKRVRILLNNIFFGNNLNEVMDKYETLSSILNFNNVNFSYNDGTDNIFLNERMQVESYSEPQDWKQYDGQANIELFYFEPHGDSLPIQVSYGAYVFESTPTWAREVVPNRPNIFTTESPSGIGFGQTFRIQLRGQLTADNHSDLRTKMNALEAAFSDDATLTYGDFVQPVSIIRHSILEIVPEKLAYFSAEFEYQVGDLVRLDIRIRYSRLHRNPIIKEMPLCDARIIKLMNLSGQFVDYSIAAQSSNISLARSIVSQEATFLVVPGGIEIDGGSEEWDYNTVAVNVNIRKFYNSPILTNLQSLPPIFFGGVFDPAG